jgi:hypothetical protein
VLLPFVRALHGHHLLPLLQPPVVYALLLGPRHHHLLLLPQPLGLPSAALQLQFALLSVAMLPAAGAAEETALQATARVAGS